MIVQRIRTQPPSPSTMIRIKYEIPDDLQKSYHCNPGRFFQGTIRTAYLPDSEEGGQLLKRLVYAFLHGLTFQVSPSMSLASAASTATTSLGSDDHIDSDNVTWGSIPHKTKMCNSSAVLEVSEDVHGINDGFADTNYFVNCHAVLDHLGVPREPLGAELG